MKSLITKSIYAGLGLLGTGRETVEQLGRKLAKQAKMSEKDGEKIARDLRKRSEKAVTTLRKTLESEVSKVVNAFHAASKELGHGGAKKPKAPKKPAKKRRRAAA